jgi:Flp pilus assembly protein TadD
VLWNAGRTDEADSVFRAAIARDSSADVVAANLFVLYISSGRNQDAATLVTARHDTSALRHAVARARDGPAERAVALAMLDGMRTQHVGGRPAINVAKFYAILGERETALAMLERAAAERNPGLEFIAVEPGWESVRRDPRFAAVVRQIGLMPPQR